jgi:hypothetical protein
MKDLMRMPAVIRRELIGIVLLDLAVVAEGLRSKNLEENHS